jgi:hypothetical protein
MRFIWLALATLLVAAPLRAQEHEGATRSGAVFVPRLGFLLAGSGEAESDCSGSGAAGATCPEIEAGDTDYDDESGFGFGVDILGNLSQNFRLGGGLWFVPDGELEGDADTEYGSDLSLFFVAEGLLDVAPRVALSGRFLLGGLILFPSEDLEDAVDTLETACDQARAAGASCDVNDGPYLGPTFGAGVGVVGSLGRVALRGDFIAQWYSVDVASVEASGAGGELETSINLSGTRFWLTMGLEF